MIDIRVMIANGGDAVQYRDHAVDVLPNIPYRRLVALNHPFQA